MVLLYDNNYVKISITVKSSIYENKTTMKINQNTVLYEHTYTHTTHKCIITYIPYLLTRLEARGGGGGGLLFIKINLQTRLLIVTRLVNEA